MSTPLRRRYLIPVLLAFACATSPQPTERSAAAARTEQTQAAAPVALAAAPEPASKAAPGPVLPDIPAGSDAARDAELSKKAGALVDAFLNTEAILTRDLAAAARFTDAVDTGTVVVNASTRFTDGAEFGFGAEIGISTQKLHARGPMALRELTTYKYVVWGDGQIRD